MAKRGAEDQLTKDDAEDGRGRSDDEVEERRDAPPEALAERKIRGMPKRKAVAPAATAPAPAASTPLPSFSFGAPSSSSSSAPNPFSFGAPSTTPAIPSTTSTPSFSFGAPVTSSVAPATAAPAKTAFSGFSFGSTSTPPISTPAPAAPSVSTSSKETSDPAPVAAPKPFSGFSFGSSASVAPPASAAAASSGASSAFGNGFSFATPSSSATKVGQAGSSSNGLYPALPASVTEIPAVSSNPIKPVETALPASTASTSQPSEKEKMEKEYLLSIRGLNVSLIRALEVKLREDPFVDLGVAMKRLETEYEDRLNEIKKKAGKEVTASVEKPVTGAMQVDKPVQEKPTEKIAPVVVEPPKVGGFKLPAPASSNAPPVTGGFKPSAPITAFSFGGKTVGAGEGTAATTSTSTTSAFGAFKPNLPATSSTTTPAFSFNSAPASTTPVKEPPTSLSSSKGPSAAGNLVRDLLAESDKTDAPAEKKEQPAPPATPAQKAPVFSFGSTTPASPAPGSLSKRPSAIFAIKPDVRKSVGGGSGSMVVPTESTPTAPFIFKASPSFNVGSGGSTSAPPPPAGASTPGSTGGFSFSPASKPRTASVGFSFGKDSAPSTPAAGESSTAAVSKPAFSFGAPASTSSAFSFGKPTETGGFSFGAPAASGSSVPKPSPFGFSAPSASTSTSQPATETPADEVSAPVEKQTSLTVGAGEENEDTLYEAKAQVGELGTDEKGDPKWGDWKICLVRLKREVKEEGQDDSQPMRRMLMRVDPSGHIAHNFSLRSLQAVSPLGPSGLKLSVVGTGGLQHLALRFGKKKPDFDPEVLMTKLKNAIETERRSMKLPEFAS